MNEEDRGYEVVEEGCEGDCESCGGSCESCGGSCAQQDLRAKAHPMNHIKRVIGIVSGTLDLQVPRNIDAILYLRQRMSE